MNTAEHLDLVPSGRIRLADVGDVKHILVLAKELLEQSVYSGIKMDETKFKRTVAMLLGSKNGIVYVIVDDQDIPQGFLLGVIDELFYSTERYASDLAVYVREGYRMMAPFMFRRFISWAKSKPKVSEISLGVSSGIGDVHRIGKMYERLGFTQVGGLFVMRVDA